MENRIIATCNFPNKTWDILEDGYYPGSFHIALNILYDNTVQVKDVTYGANFYIENNLIGEETYPKSRLAINTMTSGYAVEACFDLEKGKNHRVNVWAVINGERIEKDILIENVIHPQPYPSWRLVNNEWQPPIPMPEVGIYNWNENKRQWVLIENDYMPGAGGSTTDPNL
jgi:hypothetical protein